MTRENLASVENLAPGKRPLPETGPNTVEFWAEAYRMTRKLFVKKLTMIGVEPDPVFHTVYAEELHAATKRFNNERKRKTPPRSE